ncbi:MAG: hypothetical protein PHO03_02480 [Candidatus Omnitrophica bacterium]|nr:hypothetical protein [Candidatus Omnitrophota bacterium]
MKKWILVLTLALMAQFGYRGIPVWAQEEAVVASSEAQEKDSAEIKKVIETFLECSRVGDLDCAMSHVSKEFLGVLEGESLDYAGLRLHFENSFSNTTDRSFSNLNVLELNVGDDNKATVLVEYELEAFNLKTSARIKKSRRVQYSLYREGGTWKILSLEQS